MEKSSNFQTSDNRYDVIIIGAGMSGLAAGIRLAHFGQKVVILERHNVTGGLNSFYSIDGRKYDVGLHALTNFVRPGVKGTPLQKLLRQLRIDRDELDLCEQIESQVNFDGTILRFSNDYELFESEVARTFPNQIDGFRRLAQKILEYDELSLDAKPISGRKVVEEFISDPKLVDMIFCPLMIYGSSQENDMEFGQFVIMFKSIYQEGFSRPFEGVRRILKLLARKYKEAGGELRIKTAVRQIVVRNGQAEKVILENGQELSARHVLSSIGVVETLQICSDQHPTAGSDNVGRLSFAETISVLKTQPAELGWNSTIIFFNDSSRFSYARPDDLIDPRSGVICFPNNFHYGDRQMPEGMLRITCLANYDRWKELGEEKYQEAKKWWFGTIRDSALRFLPKVPSKLLDQITVATDMFTPRTVEKFTGHLAGAVYGATHKVKNGATHLENLYLCGTDQGFLGIIGSMLSGISMANLHVLTKL